MTEVSEILNCNKFILFILMRGHLTVKITAIGRFCYRPFIS